MGLESWIVLIVRSRLVGRIARAVYLRPSSCLRIESNTLRPCSRSRPVKIVAILRERGRGLEDIEGRTVLTVGYRLVGDGRCSVPLGA